MKKLISSLTVLVLMITMILPVAADDSISVTLRVESLDKTVYSKTLIKNVKDSDGNGTISPMEVLDAANLFYELNDYGSVGVLESINDMWCYAINNDSSIDPAVLKDNDSLVYYLYDYTQGNYIYFEKDEYTTTVDKTVTLTLKAESYDNSYNRVIINKENVSILTRKQGESDYTTTKLKTDENGQVQLDFDEAGTYEVMTSLKGNSRAYTVVTVSEATNSNPYTAINTTIKSINIPETTDSNIDLPTYSSDYSQTITWTSNKPEVLSEEGVVNRGTEDEVVILKATVSDGTLTKTVYFEVTVLKDDSQYDAGTLNKQTAIWATSGNNQAITDTKTAISSSDINEKWVNSSVNATSSPIIVGNYIYVTNSSNQLVRLDKDGNIVKKVNLSSSLSYVTDLCYGDGMIFVPLKNGTIQAFNESNLASLWISKSLEQQVTSKLTYANGYLFAGTMGSSKNGVFFALNVEDEDTTLGNEVKDYLWTYNAEGRNGYYSNQAIVIGNNVYFVGDDGVLVNHSISSNKVNKTLTLDSGVRSGITYNDGYLYINDRSSTLYKIDASTLKIVKKVQLYENGSSTSTPTIYNNRIYVGGSQDSDNFYSKGYIAVVDATSLSVITKQETNADVKAMPLVTTAYANSKNKNSVVVYFTTNSTPGGVYSFIDYEGNNSITIEELYTPTNQNYNMNSVIVDNKGVLYFVNDTKNIYALENTNSSATITFGSEVEETTTKKEESKKEESNKTETTVKKSKTVQTGDNTTYYPYIIGIVCAVIVLIVILKKGKSKKQ